MSMMYIPKNKKTGVVYPAITQAEKDAYEAQDSPVKGKYTFAQVPEPKPAPPPIESRQVKDKKETVAGDTAG